MICTNCKRSFHVNELDTDGFCYDCANYDPDYNPDNTAIVKELVENTMHTLAAAKRESTTKVMSDFVAEHVYKNPQKYIKDVVEQATKKLKKNASGGN